MIYRKYVKRLIDFILSLSLLIVISPLFFVLCLLIAINLGTPIFFKQKRTTENQKEFNIIKFRTMTEAKDVHGDYLPNEQRKTPFGNALRSSSLDELPELINIIKGDMAIIGPRPLPSEYSNYYNSSEMGRFNVRGGLIPPDSICSTPLITWDEQLKMEAEYGRSLSLSYDAKILFAAFKMIGYRNKLDYGKYRRESLVEERNNKDE